MEAKQYTISEAAKKLHVGSHVLRFWEEELHLNIPRNEMGHRVYSEKEMKQLEQDADVVMFLYRDEYYTKDASTKKGITEIIIGKQRNGPTCTVELKWLNQYTKFANLEYHDE